MNNEPKAKLPQSLRELLELILDTQESYLKQYVTMDAQIHAHHIMLISMYPEKERLRVAQVLQETFEEQRALRQQALDESLAMLALLRVAVPNTIQ